MKKTIYIVFFTSTLFSQTRINDVKSFPSYIDVKDIDFSNELLIYASGAGIVEFDFLENSFKTVSLDDGMEFANIKRIHIDLNGNYWITSSAKIQIWSPKTKSIIGVFDLNIEEITDLINFKNAVYVAAKIDGIWGLIEFIYSDEKIYYRDYYGKDDINLISKLLQHNDLIYIQTDKGILTGNPFIEHISYWKNSYNEINKEITDFTIFNDIIYILSDNKIHKYDDGELNTILLDSFDEAYNLKKLIVSNSELYGISDSILFTIQDDKAINIYADKSLQFENLFINNDQIWIATNFGLGLYQNNEYSNYLFNQALVDNPQVVQRGIDGKLILSSNKGISIEGWSNFAADPLPKKIQSGFDVTALEVDLGEKITKSIFKENVLLLGLANSSYAGIVSFDFDQSLISLKNTYFTKAVENKDGELYGVFDMLFDKSKNLWSSTSNESYPLSVFVENGSRHFKRNEKDGNSIKYASPIVEDNYGRIWMVTNSGLLMYKYSGNILNPSSEEWFSDSLIPGINRNVLSMAISKKNTLWILTDYGLIYKELRASDQDPVAKTGPISSSNNITPYFSNIPFDQDSKIKFDSFDNLWITTQTRGLYMLTSSLNYWPSIDGINIDNSKLLSNTINDIIFNESNGVAIIATDIGISKIKIPYANEIKSPNKIQIFPNPFRIPSSKPLTVDGLPEKSIIQIITMDGSIIKTLGSEDVNAYQATWDGQDKNGKLVASGVYLMLIVSKKHGTSTIEKFAVIKG